MSEALTFASTAALYFGVFFGIFGVLSLPFDRWSLRRVLDVREAVEQRRQVRRDGGNASEELKLVLVRGTAVPSLAGLVISLPVAGLLWVAPGLV